MCELAKHGLILDEKNVVFKFKNSLLNKLLVLFCFLIHSKKKYDYVATDRKKSRKKSFCIHA